MDDVLTLTRGGVPLNVGFLPIRTLSSVCEVEVPVGVAPSPERHPYAEQVIIVDGEGTFTCDGPYDYAPGDIFLVPAGVVHWFSVRTRTVFIRLVIRKRGRQQLRIAA